MCRSFTKGFPGRGSSLWESDHPTVVKCLANIGNVTHFHLSLHFLSVSSPGSLYTYGPCIGQHLGQQALLHGFGGCYVIDVEFGPPEVTYILDTVLTSAQAGVEHMEHGHHIREIGLVVTDKEHFFPWQLAYHLGSFDFQGVKPLVSLVGHYPHDPDQPLLEKQYMSEWISFK